MATVWKNMLTGRGGFIGGQNRASGAWVGLADYLITALEPWVSITSLSSIVSSWDIREGGFIEGWMADHHYGDGLKLFTRVGKGRRTLPRLIKEQPVELILREAILVEMSWSYGHFPHNMCMFFGHIIIIINITKLTIIVHSFQSSLLSSVLFSVIYCYDVITWTLKVWFLIRETCLTHCTQPVPLQ